ITGRKRTAVQNRNAYQEIPHAPLFAPVTKLSAQVDSSDHLQHNVQQAWRAAVTGTPRPVHIDVAGLQGEFVQDGPATPGLDLDPKLFRSPPYRPVPSAGEITEAVDAIRSAKRIAILAGSGATWSD